MKVVILAGGLGTRLSEMTELVPKPMVPIGGKPIIWHIMQTYANFGYKDFVVALGYKAETVKEYFLHYRSLSSDFSVNLGSGEVRTCQTEPIDWQVALVDTGVNTMTGGRIKRLKSYIGDETFMLTYGDGVANVDIDRLMAFHRRHGKMVTVTAVHPGARFGELDIDGDEVHSFREKPQLTHGWINGGFFVVQPEFLDLIEGDETLLEHEPMEQVADMGELVAYKHDGFWQCMDTKRDHALLEELWAKGEAPWWMGCKDNI